MKEEKEEKELIDLSQASRPEGGLTGMDKLLGMRGEIPFGATIEDFSNAVLLTDANKPRIQELAGIDYSILGERLEAGWFWCNRISQRSQVYSMTVRASTTVRLLSSENRGYWDIGVVAPGVSSVFKVEGFYVLPGVVMGALVSFKDFLVYAEIEPVSSALVVGGRAPLETVGKVLTITATIFYTKI